MNAGARHVKFGTGMDRTCIYPAPMNLLIIVKWQPSEIRYADFPKISVDLQTAFVAETHLAEEQWLKEQLNMVTLIITIII
jgi:hypothetical protein